jgi:4-amino-4-deoxychorismate lyase
MSLLFETIRVFNGVPQHLVWHEGRMNCARMELWEASNPLFLEPEISVPEEFSAGSVRCNIYYGPEIGQVSFTKYEKRAVRSLKRVNCDEIDYHLKYSDRAPLETLFLLRGNCDEIIIVKNGLITDTSMSNLIFFNGKNWFTPARPLLKGTCRERLLAEGKLIEQDIRAGNLQQFTACKLINSMRDPDSEDCIPISNIK